MTQTKPIRIGLSGALGRMGGAVASVLDARDDVVLAALFDRADLAGQPAHGRVLTTLAGAIAACDVIIDFSTPAASVALAQACATNGGPALVVASTGFSADEAAAVDAASDSLALVRSGNFSLGVNLLLGLVRQAARVLDPADWDIEITEARGVLLEDVADRARDGLTGPRKPGAIGFSVVRGGGVVGEHGVVFAAEDELITLSHSARDRSLFARGAVAAAIWAHGRAPGLYDLMDVLGFSRD